MNAADRADEIDLLRTALSRASTASRTIDAPPTAQPIGAARRLTRTTAIGVNASTTSEGKSGAHREGGSGWSSTPAIRATASSCGRQGVGRLGEHDRPGAAPDAARATCYPTGQPGPAASPPPGTAANAYMVPTATVGPSTPKAGQRTVPLSSRPDTGDPWSRCRAGDIGTQRDGRPGVGADVEVQDLQDPERQRICRRTGPETNM